MEQSSRTGSATRANKHSMAESDQLSPRQLTTARLQKSAMFGSSRCSPSMAASFARSSGRREGGLDPEGAHQHVELAFRVDFGQLTGELCGRSGSISDDDDAPGRNRTCDLSLRRRTLYPLSYGRGDGSG
jgi:hypothetical protein